MERQIIVIKSSKYPAEFQFEVARGISPIVIEVEPTTWLSRLFWDFRVNVKSAITGIARAGAEKWRLN